MQDANGNIPPSGTTLSVAGDGYEITSASATVRNSLGNLTTNQKENTLNESPFGMYHTATFTEDGVVKNIKVTVSLGNNTEEVVLQRP
ncbi:hypothetical protein A3759_17620 [Thalassolituus sp. HI0120]|nr:hypothetical protein A3759_17620 [Thalassolituus sp. HI0120]